MSTARDNILQLAHALAAHQGVTHWAISMRMEGKGDAFDRLMGESPRDMRTTTYERRMSWFADNWPADLPWPAGVPRPKRVKAGVRS